MTSDVRPETALTANGRAFLILKYAYVALAFAYIAGAFGQAFISLTPGAGGYDDRQSGTFAIQLVSAAFYLPGMLLLVGNIDRTIRTIARAWPIALMIGLAIASTVWSVAPDVTIRRAIALLLTMLFTLYVATAFRPREFLTIAAWVCVAIIVVSALSVAVPGWGLESMGSYVGAVRGVFPEKNLMGRFTGLALLLLLAMIWSEPRGSRSRYVFIGVALLGFVLLILSNARTPLLALIVGGAVMWAAAFIAHPRGWQTRFDATVRAILVAAGALMALVVVPVVATAIILMLGRDLTLTGRLKLWDYAINIGLDRPVLGAGFGAFWTDALTYDLRSLHTYWDVEGAITKALTANAHNGYLDIWLELGTVGLILFIIMLVTTARRGMRALRGSDDRLLMWPIGVVTFMAVYYLTNSGVMDHSEIGSFCLAYALMMLSARELVVGRTPRAVSARRLSSRSFRPRGAVEPAR